MAKKYDLPAMPFYWGDWFKCPEVRALSPEARCLWFEMLGLMWESTERGYLTLAGKPMTKETISRCLGFACDLLERLLAELLEYGVCSVRDDGAIFNRRMVRDAEISSKRASAGKIGGICSSKTRSKTQANTEDEDEDEDEDVLHSPNCSNSTDMSGHYPDMMPHVDTYPIILDTPAFREAWGEWEAHRREKKKPIRPRSRKAAMKQLSAIGPARAIAAIENSIANDYQGIFESKSQQRDTRPPGPQYEKLRQ
jgi:hypothetical protein